MRIPDPLASGYVLRHPFQRGGFNTVGYVSQQEFLGDVETLYATILRDELGIEREDLKVSRGSQDIAALTLLKNVFVDLPLSGLLCHFPHSRSI